MTVRELIDQLKTMPQDWLVVRQSHRGATFVPVERAFEKMLMRTNPDGDGCEVFVDLDDDRGQDGPVQAIVIV